MIRKFYILCALWQAMALAALALEAEKGSGPLFIVRGAPNETLRATIERAAVSARARLQERWPKPLSQKPLPLIWYDSQNDMAAAAGRRVDGVLALADKGSDRVLLNGPLLRQAGAGQIRETLQHEMVHVNFGRERVDRLPRWLEEGLAMRLSDQQRWYDGWLAAGDHLFGRTSGAEDLWGGWPDDPAFESRAYRQAESLTEFLLRKHYPEGGERQVMSILLSRRDSEDFIDQLWQPYTRMSLYREWLNEGGKIGPLLTLVTDPTFLFGGVCVVLLVWAWLAKRRRGQIQAEEWVAEGPYFGQPEDKFEDENEGEDEDGEWEDGEWEDGEWEDGEWEEDWEDGDWDEEEWEDDWEEDEEEDEDGGERKEKKGR